MKRSHYNLLKYPEFYVAPLAGPAPWEVYGRLCG